MYTPGVSIPAYVLTTSSAAALSTAQSGPTRHPHAEDGKLSISRLCLKLTLSEWNDAVVEQVKEQGASAPPPLKYHASKVVSERALWAFFAKRQPHFDGVALLVAYVSLHLSRLITVADLAGTWPADRVLHYLRSSHGVVVCAHTLDDKAHGDRRAVRAVLSLC